VELARSLGTLKAALLHAGVPIPPEARPSSALQHTVQVMGACSAAASARTPHSSRSAWSCLKAHPLRQENLRLGPCLHGQPARQPRASYHPLQYCHLSTRKFSPSLRVHQ
jgi:hypothetical protein